MFTRRDFVARVGGAAAVARLLPEMALAQKVAVDAAGLPKDVVWLNANENPAGVPEVSQAAMREVLPSAYRYQFQQFGEIEDTIAKSEELSPEQIFLGAGSSEPLHGLVDIFTSPSRPLITVTPAYEGPIQVAHALGHRVVLTKLREDYTADVHRLAEEADKAHGGLIYLCNPNNPTSAVTRAKDLAWLASNLPANTMLLMDEAYIHFVEATDVGSALPYVRQGKNVIVARTYQNLRHGRAARGVCRGASGYHRTLLPLRMNVISIVSARAVTAALGQQQTILSERKASMARRAAGFATGCASAT